LAFNFFLPAICCVVPRLNPPAPGAPAEAILFALLFIPIFIFIDILAFIAIPIPILSPPPPAPPNGIAPNILLPLLLGKADPPKVVAGVAIEEEEGISVEVAVAGVIPGNNGKEDPPKDGVAGAPKGLLLLLLLLLLRDAPNKLVLGTLLVLLLVLFAAPNPKGCVLAVGFEEAGAPKVNDDAGVVGAKAPNGLLLLLLLLVAGNPVEKGLLLVVVLLPNGFDVAPLEVAEPKRPTEEVVAALPKTPMELLLLFPNG